MFIYAQSDSQPLRNSYTCALRRSSPGLGQSVSRAVPNNTAGALAVGTATWNINRNATGDAVDVAAVPSVPAGATISNLPGRPQNLPAINSNPANAEQANGFLAESSASGTGFNQLYWTTEYATGTTTLNSVRWTQGNDAGSDVMWVALRVNNSWFASDATFTQTAGIGGGGDFATLAEQKELLIPGARWRVLTFTPGTELSISAFTTGLSTGEFSIVTGFGLYTDNKSSTQRFDTFELTTAPEAGTLPLFVAASAVGAFVIVSRRRRLCRCLC